MPPPCAGPICSSCRAAWPRPAMAARQRGSPDSESHRRQPAAPQAKRSGSDEPRSTRHRRAAADARFRASTGATTRAASGAPASRARRRPPAAPPATAPAADRDRRRGVGRRSAAASCGSSTARDYELTDDAFIDVHMVRVAPQVAGRVAQVPVDDNQAVAAGQLLVKIDPAPLQRQARPGRGQSGQCGRHPRPGQGAAGRGRGQRRPGARPGRRRPGQRRQRDRRAQAQPGPDRQRGLLPSAVRRRDGERRRTAAALVAAQRNLEAAEAQFGVTEAGSRPPKPH